MSKIPQRAQRHEELEMGLLLPRVRVDGPLVMHGGVADGVTAVALTQVPVLPQQAGVAGAALERSLVKRLGLLVVALVSGGLVTLAEFFLVHRVLPSRCAGGVARNGRWDHQCFISWPAPAGRRVVLMATFSPSPGGVDRFSLRGSGRFGRTCPGRQGLAC